MELLELSSFNTKYDLSNPNMDHVILQYKYGSRDMECGVWNADVQGTEHVFNKVVHPGQNIRLVDKDGIPLRMPSTATLSRIHSTYVLSPRGVPTRKSNHAYSGQQAQAKMQYLFNSLETNTQDMVSYASLHNVGNGPLSSAGSSRHHMAVNLTPKKRSFGSGSHSGKSLPTKSASKQRTRCLTSAPATEQMSQEMDPDGEKSNDSPQGKRLEKEWSALSQSRALKRSSEIVSHRVDRMYFMTGNKLKIQSKYHVEDDELKLLRDLSQARASARTSRSCSRKSYRPSRLSESEKTMTNGDKSRDMNHTGTDDTKRPGIYSRENGQKENSSPKVMVFPKVLTAKPSNRKSPLLGWGGEENSEKASAVENDILQNLSLHEGKVDDAEAENVGDSEAIKRNVNEDKAEIELNKAENIHTDVKDGGEDVKTENNENPIFVTEENMEDIVDDSKGDTDEKGDKENDDKSVHNNDERSVISDKDKTEVKSEDYIEQAEVDE